MEDKNYVLVEANDSQTLFVITIGSEEPMDEEALVEELRHFISRIEEGSEEMDFFYNLIQEQ